MTCRSFVSTVWCATALAIALAASAAAAQPAGEPGRQQLLVSRQTRMAEAQQHLQEGEFGEAIAAAEEVLAIERQVFGEIHPAVVDTLWWISQAQQSAGSFAAANQRRQEALAILEKALAAQSESLAVLNRLGLLLFQQGDYFRAEPILRRADEIAAKQLGPQHAERLACLSNLASLYQTRGEYARAEPLLRELVEGAKKAYGEQDPAYAGALNNLAGLYQAIGDDARAEPLWREALEIRRASIGPEHPDFATSLNNLAGLYYERGDYERARPLFEEALAIREKALGKRHPDYAVSLNNLAAVCEAQDQAERAETLYQQALDLRGEVLGDQHPDYAASLNNLAAFYRARREYARAEPLYRQALEIRRATLGSGHPDYAASLNNLAVLYRSMGDFERAAPLYHEALGLQQKLLRETFLVLSERQQIEMTRTLRRTLDGYLSVTGPPVKADQRAYEHVLAWKGSVFAWQSQARRMPEAPERAALWAELQSSTSRLAARAFALPAPDAQAAWREEIAALSAEKERIEAELARQAGRTPPTATVTGDTLRKALPHDVVLIDFLEYLYSPPIVGDGDKSPSERLAAFIVRASQPVERVELGEIAPIREAIDTWRRTYGGPGSGAAAARDLRARLWQPLETRLAGAEVVLLSPDGDLARLAWAALPGTKPGTWLLEEFALAVVPAAQVLPEMLAAAPDRTAAESPSLVLVGDVDYDTAAVAKGSDAPAERGLEALWHFTALDNARGEMLAVRDSFESAFPEGRVEMLRGRQATEEGLRARAAAGRFLHIVTHGFFAPPEWSSAMAPADDGSRQATPKLTSKRTLGLERLHPGLLSGLALAGANQTGGSETDDGILTAEEVGSLDLRHTDLAVLSACETGLGAVAGGEGVLGLQRALQVAGSRTVVASLWKVSDEQTRQLMERFYENLWAQKMGKLEALRQAQLSLLRQEQSRGMKIVARPAADKPPERLAPYYWAAFVLSGDWR